MEGNKLAVEVDVDSLAAVENVACKLQTLKLDENQEASGSRILVGDGDPEPEVILASSPHKESQLQPFPLTRLLAILPPTDTIERIFGRLGLGSKEECRLVCKEWKRLVDAKLIFKPIFHDFEDAIEEVTALGESGVSIDLTISCLQRFNYPHGGLRWTGIEGLTFIPFQCTTRLLGGPHWIGISNTNLNRVLTEFSNIKRLDLHSGALKDIADTAALRETSFPFLETLSLSASNTDGPIGFTAATDILQNNFPKLKELKTVILAALFGIAVPVPDNVVVKPLKQEELYDFISRHRRTLMVLTSECTYDVDGVILDDLEPIHDHDMPADKFESVKDDLHTLSLDSYSVQLSSYDGSLRYLFVPSILEAQNVLTYLKLENLTKHNRSIWNYVPELVRRCSKTIHTIVVSGCICAGVQEQEVLLELDTFSCSYLSNCKNLEILRLGICGLRITDERDLPSQLKELELGNRLSEGHIENITSCLPMLEEWKLGQDFGIRDLATSKISVRQFKRILRMPSLRLLKLRKRTSSHKQISRIASYTPGMTVVGISERDWNEDAEGGLDIEYYRVVVDRNVFDWNRL